MHAASIPLNVLIIDDSEDDALLLLRHLSSSGWKPDHLRVDTREGLEAAFVDRQWHIVLSDYSMPKLSVENALEIIKANDENLPVIVVTGAMREDELIRLIKLGAKDIILKNNLSRLKPAVEREIADALQRRETANAESRFLNALDCISQGIALYDVDDRLVLCNERYREIMHPIRDNIVPGATFEEIITQAVRTGHLTDPASTPDELIAHQMNRHRNPEPSFEQPLADERWLKIQKQRTAEGGVISILTDITEAKKMTIMKDEFISVVSHELRTPLTSIRGSVALLELKLKHDPSASQLIDIALRNSDRLSRLVNDILNLGKLKAGEMELYLRQLNSWDPIVQAVEASRHFADQYGVTIVAQEPERKLQIVADAEKLIQVLVNLLSNAAKFSPNGSTVTIGVEQNDRLVQIYISDQGPGIPTELAEAVFDKFFQVDSSDTRSRGGVGLGLSISREIVKALGGNIRFESLPGNGTTFFVEFPAATGTVSESFEEPQGSIQQEHYA